MRWRLREANESPGSAKKIGMRVQSQVQLRPFGRAEEASHEGWVGVSRFGSGRIVVSGSDSEFSGGIIEIASAIGLE